MTFVASVVTPKPKLKPRLGQRTASRDRSPRRTDHGSSGKLPPTNAGNGDHGRRLPDDQPVKPPSPMTGMLLLLAGITMMFMAFTSAYLVRSADADWRQLAVPSLFWLSTVMIIASSGTMELARRAVHERPSLSRLMMMATVLFGLGFVASQFGAWQQLLAAGFNVAWGPHSGFIYLLTSVHVAHVVGGLIYLLSTTWHLWGPQLPAKIKLRLDMTALYWHFVGGLWLYVFALLFVF